MTPDPRLAALVEIVRREVQSLGESDAGVFAEPMTVERARSLTTDRALAERIDAFGARFARLQDTVGDKLLPSLLRALAEPVGPALDNLDRAERFGWLDSATEWVEARKLRNRLTHDYVTDPAELSLVLAAAHAAVPMLVAFASRLIAVAERPAAG